MWLLLIVFLSLPGHDAVIDSYANEEDCQTERDRIGYQMAEAYPYGHDFDIVCRYWATTI